MNDKIECVANAVLNGNDRPTQTVNLSAGGIAFFHADEIETGKRLRTKIVFRPSFRGIICSAMVIDCQHLPKEFPDAPYRIAIKFNDLTEQEEQLLHRHILQKQVQSLKKN